MPRSPNAQKSVKPHIGFDDRAGETQSRQSVHQRWLTGAGVRLHAVECGPPDARPVLLLHGFPEFWYGWHHQLSALSNAGLRAIAVDQRGYNLSDKPRNIREYDHDILAADIAACADSLGAREIDLVGHDWGGVVSWWTALRFPSLVRRMVILNAPHPSAMRKVIRRSAQQALRSWYVYMFQLPRAPERLFRIFGAQAMRRSARPGTFTDTDIQFYRAAWAQPRALTSMINWYRASLRSAFTAAPSHTERNACPTKILWGVQDAALVPELAMRSAEYCYAPELQYFSQATHWLQHEEPQAVNRAIAEFLSRP